MNMIFDADVIKQHCDAVILAGGQGTRMQGCNKLLQKFDGQQRQLEKLVLEIRPQVRKIWINSHRDENVYQTFDPEIAIFPDIQAGFLGPMMGMLSAWQHIQQDWILFIPCDLFKVPEQLLDCMIDSVIHMQSQLCYAVINKQALYPLCLMHRSVRTTLMQQIEDQEYSLHRCFDMLKTSKAYFEMLNQTYHSINSWAEIKYND